MDKEKSPSWVTLTSCSTTADAHIAAGLLQANDIPVVINNETIANVYPMTDSWAPVEIMVPTELADEARKLLKLD